MIYFYFYIISIFSRQSTSVRLIQPLLLLALLSLASCLGDTKPPMDRQTLFGQLSEEQSGIHFSNDIVETEHQNIILFPYYYNGGGVAVGDLNHDELPDVYFTGNMVGDRLYYNDGGLAFSDVTIKSGILSSNLWTTGVTFADINNDGWLDIYVCRSGMGTYRNNLLYINLRNGRFKEQAKDYGINDNGYSVQAYFCDLDLDGDLDMYLVNHSRRFFDGQEALFNLDQPDSDERDKLFINDGEGHFTDMSIAAGINHFAFGLSAAIADFNGDGYPDIYAASDFFEPDYLYINQKDGTFLNELPQMMGHTSFSSMGSDAADFNNDGLIDLIVCDMQSADNYRKKALMASMDIQRFRTMVDMGYHYQYMQNALQLNRGVGRFSEIAELAGVAETDWSWGPLFADFDNDGWKDLFISNGIRRDIQYKDIQLELEKKGLDPRENILHLVYNFPVKKLRNYVFKNDHPLVFSDKSMQWGIDHEGFSTGASFADLDLDGDLDLVLNNIDDKASVYENQQNLRINNYLQIKLIGSKDNAYGIGSKVKIVAGGTSQFQCLKLSRGFQSSSEPIIHFGMGEQSMIDTLTITWPNQISTTITNISVNQRLEITQDNEFDGTSSTSFSTRLFERNLLIPEFVHSENPFDDFEKEVLLPHRYSQLGPFICVGDVNGDAVEDFYVGGAKDQPGQMFVQHPSGEFSTTSSQTWRNDRAYEDMGVAFLDYDDDGDLDLYVASGGNEAIPNSDMYQDRLYNNDGDGHFTALDHILPPSNVSSSVIRPADFDKDGDMDIFVAGRQTPNKYPIPTSSQLLLNHGAKYVDVTSSTAPELIDIGMVTDAQWTDFDGDHDLDLILVGEWMAITLLENVDGKYTLIRPEAFDQSRGWWYALTQADVDQDGDMDYFAGNLGLNYKYRATRKEPFQVYAHDFDDSGTLDIVLGYFNDGQLFPLRGRQCSSEQMPTLKENFPSYSAFASATLIDVYGENDLEQALHYEADNFASIYIENKGSGDFEISYLPTEAQFSSINAFETADLNHDGHLDVVLGGNMFGSEVETARNDASLGLILLGDGQGSFSPVPPAQSGFITPGDVKSMAKITIAETLNILIGNNNGKLEGFALHIDPKQ